MIVNIWIRENPQENLKSKERLSEDAPIFDAVFFLKGLYSAKRIEKTEAPKTLDY